ncbi:MAG: hypothetical protein V5A68_07855, partial [Candidatus Thermoplasmatota archaeon]
MEKKFDRNMFIMLFAIMLGVVIITYFVADIARRSEIENLESEIKTKNIEIENVKEDNINFTTRFLKSSGVLDKAREDRADGNYNFDVGFLWYTTALSEQNATQLENYKNKTIVKCENAMVNYTYSHKNFNSASDFYIKTKNYTVYNEYLSLLDLYVNLSKSGSKLTMHRYNASLYLKYLAENLTLENNKVVYNENISDLQDSFNESTMMYQQESETFEQLSDEITEYDIEGF